MNKVDDLLERLECVKLARSMEPDPDALSLSLWAMGAELAELDEQGKAELLQSLNENGLNLGLDDLERFIADYMEV